MIVASAIIGPDGKIYTGKRHCFIMHDESRPKGFLKFGEQGFVTDTGEFLNREDAAKHAIACGQITKLKFSSKHLFSEELW